MIKKVPKIQKFSGPLEPVSQTSRTVIPSASLLNLSSTPFTILPALPAGQAYLLERVIAQHSGGTAYLNLGDILLKYTNGSGTTLATITSSGFLSTAAAVRNITATTSNYAPVSGALVCASSTLNFLTGNYDLTLTIFYKIINV